MRPEIKKITTLFVFALLLASCSKENVVQEAHQGKVSSTDSYKENSFTPSYINQLDAKMLHAVDLERYNKPVWRNAQVSDPVQIEQELRKYINQRMIDQFQNHPKLKKILIHYNRAVLNILKSRDFTASGELNTVLNSYYKLAFAECDINLAGCKNLIFFNKDYNNSAQIILFGVTQMDKEIESKIAKNKSYTNDLKKYYKYLALVQDLRNSRHDDDFDSLYIKYSYEYAKHLGSTGQEEKLAEHGSYFEQKVQSYLQLEDKSRTKKRVLHAIENFNPCNFSRKSQNRFFTFAESELLTLSSELKGKELASCFVKTMKANKDQDDHLGMSFLKLVSTLNDSGYEHSDLLKKMKMTGLKAIFDNNPAYLYIIDNLYRGYWSEADAQNITEKMDLDNSTILDVTEAYIKHQLLYTVIKTNTKMHDIYYNDKTVTSKNIYKKAIDDNSEVTNMWQEFNTRKDILKRFSLYNINKKKSNELEAKYHTLFTNLDKNIKYLTSVPQLMLMTYKMAQKEFSITVRGFFGSMKVDSNQIIRDFFRGGLPLWFKFVENTEQLKRMELLYAFDFAIRTKVFDNFAKVEGQDNQMIKPVDYFNVVISRYIKGTRELVEELEDDTEELIQKDMTEFYNVCNDKDYFLSMPLNELINRTLLGNVTKLEAFHDGAIKNQLESIRSRLVIELSFVQNMIDIYKNQNPESTEPIDAEIKSIKEKINKIYGNLVAYETNTSDCLYKLLRQEYDQQYQIIQKEKEHIKMVFDKMLEIENLETGKEEAEETFNITYNNENLAKVLKREVKSEEEYFDRISSNYYYFFRLGVLSRFVDHLKGINPNINIDLPANIEYDALYKKDSANVMHYVALPTEGTYEERLEAFTQSIFEKYNTATKSPVRWIENHTTADLDYLSNKLELLVELYKAKHQGLYSLDKTSCVGNLSELEEKTCLDKLDITAERIINETLNVGKILSINERDMEILRYFQKDRKFETSVQTKFFFKSATEPQTLLENVYMKISDNNTEAMEVMDFHKQIVQAKQDLLFMPSKEIKSILKANYAPIIRNSFNLIEDFNNAVQGIERKHSDDNTLAFDNYLYKIDLTGNDHEYITTNDGSGNITYLDPDKIEDNEKIISNFHMNTQGYFKADNTEDELK